MMKDEGTMKPQILVVDDDQSMLALIQEVLGEHGYAVCSASSFQEAMDQMTSGVFGVVVLDIVLNQEYGLKLIPHIKSRSKETEIVVMTSHSSVETAVEALRLGAYDYVPKSFQQLDEIWLPIKRAIDHWRLSQENSQLVQELERRNNDLSKAVQRLTTLNDAGRAMGTIFRIQDLMDYFLKLVVQELQVDRASLMLMDPEENLLKIVAACGIPPEIMQQVRVSLGEGVAGRVAQEGKPILVKDAAKESRIQGSKGVPYVSDSFICSPIVLSVPIKIREKTLGVINATHRRSGEPFGEEDMVFLNSLAGQAAVAIEGAHHFEELQKAYERLQETQDKLVSSERRNAIVQITSGFSHDFNNLLNGILGKTQLQLETLREGKVPDCKHLDDDLALIERLVIEGGAKLRRIQEFTGIRKMEQMQAVDLNAVVSEAIEITRPVWQAEARARGVDIGTRFVPVPRAYLIGYPLEICQAVTNLIHNAIEAMLYGGVLQMETMVEGDAVMLEVRDSGKGMNEEIQRRAFEPFFTTNGKGRGLGLSVVYGIIERHGGKVSIFSKPGSGTAVRLSFPAHKDIPVVPQAIEAVHSHVGGQVLVVEDEEPIRNVLIELLMRSGFTVTAVSDGPSGLERLHEKRFDVLLTDISMPGLSGWELAQKVRESNPTIAILVLSGWVIPQDDDRIKEAGVDQVLLKPSSLTELRSAVTMGVALSLNRRAR